MASFDRGKDFVPFTFNVGAVRVEVEFQSGLLKDLLARSNVTRDGYSNAYGNDTKIGNDLQR
jgi:hypothetical protein